MTVGKPLMISLETGQSVIQHNAYKENKIITWLGTSSH